MIIEATVDEANALLQLLDRALRHSGMDAADAVVHWKNKIAQAAQRQSIQPVAPVAPATPPDESWKEKILGRLNVKDNENPGFGVN